MFAAAYFAAVMFAPRYFPEVGAASTAVYVRRPMFGRGGSRGGGSRT
jgi:hypothetical protein